MKPAHFASIFVTALGAGLCGVVLAGCASAPKSPPSEYFVIFGRSERSTQPREFLIGYKKELEQIVSPDDLQRWAVETADAVPAEMLPKRIEAGTVPKRAVGKKLNKDQMVVTVARDEATRARMMIILDGGGGMLGWYGLKVGDRQFRPTDTDALYLEWVPGVYLFLAPP